MPRPTQLPTPQSSIQPTPKDGGHELAGDMLFELPPSAFEGTRSPPSSLSSIAEEDLLNDPDYQPLSPTSRLPRTKKKRKSSSARKEHITLPPPPSRSRKIIQMKPKCTPRGNTSTSAHICSTLTSTSPSSSSAANKSPKQPTQASRKISRKTAHSLIERRRRGKMNDEFEVLKQMIPACKVSCDSEGVREMHKLEILKASVEYIRYLKDCVCQLQSDGEGVCCAALEMETNGKDVEVNEREEDREGTTDVEMEMEQTDPELDTAKKLREEAERGREKDAKVPTDPQIMHFNPPPTPKLSPTILPKFDHRDYLIDPVTSPLTIPPQPNTSSPSLNKEHVSFSSLQALNSFTWRASLSSQTGPVMAPLPSQENDATVALLMLNGDWPSRGHMGSRDEVFSRGFGDGGRRKGLSVKDLLCS